MITRGPRLSRAGWFAALLLSSLLASACNVPVFRYALERWPADTYELVVFHGEALTTNQEAMIQAWNRAGEQGLLNLSVEKIQVPQELSGAKKELWKSQTNATLPWAVLLYPSSKEMEVPTWTGPLDSPALRILAESPARRELVRRLCGGDSAVWLLLESGDKTSDDAAAALLESESKRLQQSLQLPEAADGDPQIRSEVPLKIAFSTLRVARGNPAEQMLVNMLLRIDKSLSAIKEPMMFGIFGRGRALPPLFGKEFTAAIITEEAEFLTGACSCQVKSMNPGFDLLLAANWDGSLESKVVKDPELPPLIGMAQFASVATNTSAPAVVTTHAVVQPATPGKLKRNLGLMLLVGIVALVSGTIMLKSKAGGSKSS